MIADGSLLVRNGVLQEVGATRRVENLTAARQAIEVSADGRVVMPGFVDSHTHLLFPVAGAPRGDFEGELRVLHATTGMQLKMRARAALQAMARHGTTTVEVKTGCGADEAGEMKILRVLAELRRGFLDVVASFLFRPPRICDAGDAQSQSDWKWVRAEFLPKIWRRGLVDFADFGWDDFTESLWTGCPDREAWCEGYFQVARSLGLGCKLHADAGSVSAAALMAVKQRATSIDHLEQASEEDATVLGRADTVATLLPAVSFQRDEPFGAARRLVDAGAAVAIATNYNARETPTLSMQAVISLACHRMGMTPAEAIAAATINGAHALGCADRVGSLEYGKFADLLILNVSDYRELSYALGSNLVHMAMKRGEVIYEEGEVAPRPVEDLQPAW